MLWLGGGGHRCTSFFFLFFLIHIQIKPPLATASTSGSNLWEKWFRPGSPQHSAGEEKMLVVD